MKFFETHANELATQAASLTALPLWYPFFSKSLVQRTEILKSAKPGDLSHTKFFSNRKDYYRGISANLSLQPLYPMVEWLLSKMLEKAEQVNGRHPSFAEKIFAAFLTGCTTAGIANPYETVVIASQKNNLTPVKAFQKILKESGPQGFYRGIMPMAFKNGVFVSGLFVTSPHLKQTLDQMIPANGAVAHITKTALGAVIPATIFTMVSVPLDLAAVMKQSDPKGELYKTAVDALKEAYKKHGISALKAGALMRLFATGIEMTAFSLLNEEYKSQFRPSPR